MNARSDTRRRAAGAPVPAAGCSAALVGEYALREAIALELYELAEDVGDVVRCAFLDGWEAAGGSLDDYDEARAYAANDAGERATAELVRLASAIAPPRPSPLSEALIPGG